MRCWPSLWGVLDSACIVTTPGADHDIADRYVLAIGGDGYRTVFSLGELSPSFGNRGNGVACAETSGSGSSLLKGDGYARATAPTDVKGGRHVSNLVDLDVRSSGSSRRGLDPVLGHWRRCTSTRPALARSAGSALNAVHGCRG